MPRTLIPATTTSGNRWCATDELAVFGVDPYMLTWCNEHERSDPRVRRVLAAQHAMYTFACKGVGQLAPHSRPGVAPAPSSGIILDRIEDSDFAVVSHRATVGNAQWPRVVAVGLARAWRMRRFGSPGAPAIGLAHRRAEQQ